MDDMKWGVRIPLLTDIFNKFKYNKSGKIQCKLEIMI